MQNSVGTAAGAQPAAVGVESCYQELLQLFIRLRGRGVSVSSHDMEICLHWWDHGVPATVVAEVMTDLHQECLQEGRPFPAGLSPIARRVARILKGTNRG